MKLLYTHPNRMIVENIKNIVEREGIKVKLQNEFSGGGVGELAPIDAWPELWLVDENDFDKANTLMEKLSQQQGEDWVCGKCGEVNGGNFECCWGCGEESKQ